MDRSVLLILFSAVILVGMQSCRTHRMADNGIVPGDIDKYFNPSQEISVWIYRAFQPREEGSSGLRINRFYPMDSLVLEQIGLARRQNVVLFSVVPETEPFYHVLAVKHTQRNLKLALYDLIEIKGASYYQRDFSWNGMVIRHVYIPYRKKEGLSFVYYVNRADHRLCPFCAFDYLVKINARSFPQSDSALLTWQVLDSEEGKVVYSLRPDQNLLKGKDTVIVRIYELFENNKLLCYFRIFDKNESDSISLRLRPGHYDIEYSTEDDHVLGRSSFVVEEEPIN